MTIAIIHDSLTELGGAERVLFRLLEMFPQADLYTSLADRQLVKQVTKKFSGQIFFSKLSQLPLALNYPSLFKPYFYHYYWPSLKLDQYDLVISSSHSFCANWVKVKNFHLSYIHTPPRFLYEGQNQLSFLKAWPINWLVAPYFHYLKKIDQKKVKSIDLLLTNSKNVQARIRRIYQRKAKIIYPAFPNWAKNSTANVQTKKQAPYYLFFSRLAQQKGIALAIKAFNNLDRRLVVVGTSKEHASLKKQANKNIRFYDFLPEKKLVKIIQQAQALIYPARDEDFGMAVVEVMSQGVPVIAHDSGGPKEILNKDCAVFFEDYSVAGLKNAILDFEAKSFSAQACQEQAKKFTSPDFAQQLQKLIKQHVN